jgi:hypothetical protein
MFILVIILILAIILSKVFILIFIYKSRDPPSLIEFLSYIFNFQGIIVGPLCFYNDYIDFITGNNILKKRVIKIPKE